MSINNNRCRKGRSIVESESREGFKPLRVATPHRYYTRSSHRIRDSLDDSTELEPARRPAATMSLRHCHLNPCAEPQAVASSKFTKIALVTIVLCLVILGAKSLIEKCFTYYTFYYDVDKASCPKPTEDTHKPPYVVPEDIERPDYALETLGGSIVSTRDTQDYKKGCIVKLFGFTMCDAPLSARSVIQPKSSPGECWSFKGSSGSVIMKLIAKIHVNGVTLEHISPNLSPSNDVSSAPRVFSVYGLPFPDCKGTLLGTFEYKTDVNKPRQYFPIANSAKAYEYIELQINSNHGNTVYTCIYRFSVHGTEDIKGA